MKTHFRSYYAEVAKFDRIRGKACQQVALHRYRKPIGRSKFGKLYQVMRPMKYNAGTDQRRLYSLFQCLLRMKKRGLKRRFAIAQKNPQRHTVSLRRLQ